MKQNLICRYGISERIITENGTNLNNTMITALCGQFKIQHHNSSPYRPKINGVVEAANKNIKKIIQKMTVTYKDWHEMLPFSILYHSSHINRSNTILSGIWHGGCLSY